MLPLFLNIRRIVQLVICGMFAYDAAAMNQANDTIAAIATAPGAAGISIVRVSGPEALSIADALFRCQGPTPSERPGGTFVHGHIHSKHDLDEAILLIYRAPASYTREDVVEFQGHGGTASAQRLLRTVLNAGARLAEPGEFTQRAFLSGRIDLLQAEAVMDLIQAQSDRAASAALEQLEGQLSQAFNRLYDALIGVAADLEASLDFEEDELSTATLDKLTDDLNRCRCALQRLAQTWDEGHLLRDGATVVIAGKPNVGKSTLMNALLGKPRAIVTNIAGTTRDTLEEQLVLNGFPIRLVDTAGIREADCGIEQEGVRRAYEQLKRADLTLLLIDGSIPLNEYDQQLINHVTPNKTVIVINKTDQKQVTRKEAFTSFQTIECAAQHNMGIDALKHTMIEKLSLDRTPNQHAAISERHLQLINKAQHYLNRAFELMHEGAEACEAMAATEIRDAIETLGRVTGRSYHDELLSTIFSRFCVGK